jgi:hypothetical protein
MTGKCSCGLERGQSEDVRGAVGDDVFFWVVASCRLLRTQQRFGETCCLHLQGRENLKSHIPVDELNKRFGRQKRGASRGLTNFHRKNLIYYEGTRQENASIFDTFFGTT